MALHKRRDPLSDKRFADGTRQRLRGQQGNQPRHKVWILIGFDDHGELHGRLAHFDRGLGVGKLGAIHNVGPLDQFFDGLRIESEALFGDGRQELAARLEIGIVKLAAAGILLKVGGIGRRKKSALMMIEPPGDLGRGGIFEIYYGVLVTIKLAFIEQRAGAVDEAAEAKLNVFAHALAVKTRE